MKTTRFLRIAALLLALTLVLTPCALADEFTPPCEAAIVMEVESGIILYHYMSDIRVYPASLTKVMTALVAVEHCGLDEMLTVNGEVLANLHPDSTTANLVDGEVLSLRDLLYCLFLVSANDASMVIAEHVGGTVENFVQMMNDKAAELGCTGTQFANPHGLHEEGHYTTARDLLRMAEAFWLNDTLMEISDTEHYEIPATSHNNPHNLYTIIHTGYTGFTPYYYYEGCRGIKTGSTSAAGKCLIVSCEREGLEVLAVVTGAPSTITRPDGMEWQGNYAAMHDVLDYTYKNFDMAILREVYADEIAERQAAGIEPQPMPELPAASAPEPVEPEPVEPEPALPPVTEEPTQEPEPEQTPEPETPAEPSASEKSEEPETPEKSGLPWYGWLLLGLAALLVVYTAGYLIRNLTRPMRRKHRQQREEQR